MNALTQRLNTGCRKTSQASIVPASAPHTGTEIATRQKSRPAVHRNAEDAPICVSTWGIVRRRPPGLPSWPCELSRPSQRYAEFHQAHPREIQRRVVGPDKSRDGRVRGEERRTNFTGRNLSAAVWPSSRSLGAVDLAHTAAAQQAHYPVALRQQRSRREASHVPGRRRSGAARLMYRPGGSGSRSVHWRAAFSTELMVLWYGGRA